MASAPPSMATKFHTRGGGKMKGEQSRSVEFVPLCQENKRVPGSPTSTLLLTSHWAELYKLYVELWPLIIARGPGKS